MPPKHSRTGPYIAWTTITYRSILLFVLAVVVAIFAFLYFTFPAPTKAAMDTVELRFSALLEKVGMLSGEGKKSNAPGQQQAHFTNIDGTVRVKKSNSNTWINADYGVPLEKGDVVQTGSEGIAKVVFSDGTNYTVKQDSLIVIEENSTNARQQTEVAVNVTTGTVDLTTATYVQGSKSQVIVAGATASLAPESSAMVHNDPRQDTHEILVKKGSGEVQRGGEVVKLANFEKVSFTADSQQMSKAKEISPPTLIAPANMMPVFTPAGNATIQFSWSPVPNTSGYHVQISRNPYFSSTVFDRVVPSTEIRIPGLTEGAYYWMVRSVGDNKESVESEKNRFTIIPKGAQDVALALELEPFIQHGHVIEVKGKTEPSARVMVNGEEVPLIGGDGTFHYFTPPLPNGENVITITAQNTKGGVNTQQKKVIIQ